MQTQESQAPAKEARGDKIPTLLTDPVAQELPGSTIPARLAYTGTDGAPRVIPVWFEWNGAEFLIEAPSTSAKLRALAKNPKIALTIDNNTMPYKVLLVRGTARTQFIDTPPYSRTGPRYLGEEGARQVTEWYSGLVAQMPVKKMVQITIQPSWAKILDFQTRFPSQIAPYVGG